MKQSAITKEEIERDNKRPEESIFLIHFFYYDFQQYILSLNNVDQK